MHIIQKPLPFFDERTTSVDMIVFHCNAFTPDQFIETLHQNALSCHYIIDTNGTLIQCVPENKRAFHAGTGFWRGINTNINSRSIGIELTNPTLGQTPYPTAQIKTLIKLCQHLIQKYNIPAQNIIGHSDMAPTRKPDPGPAFPWAELAANGIGLWPIQETLPTDSTDIKQMLTQIGYDTRTSTATLASSYAFQRRFMPHTIRTRRNIRSLILHPLPRTRIKLPRNKAFLKTLQTISTLFK